MSWTDALKNLVLSGETLRLFLAGAFGAWVTISFQRWSDRRRTLKKAEHRIYDLFIQLTSSHALIVLAEIEGKALTLEQSSEFHQVRRDMRLELSKAGQLPETEGILRAMHDVGFPSEWERRAALKKLCDQLGRRLNPDYVAIDKQLQSQSEALFQENPGEYLRRFQRFIAPLPSSLHSNAAPPRPEEINDVV